MQIPHQELTSTGGVYGDFAFKAADFSSLPTHCKCVVLMPQWDFLNFLSAKAKAFPNFQLRMENEATGLINEGGRVRGVVVNTPTVQLRFAPISSWVAMDATRSRAKRQPLK